MSRCAGSASTLAEDGADFDALAKEQERLEAILASGDASGLDGSTAGLLHKLREK